MENVADALILAFAVMVFTMALTLSMNVFSQARQTSDMVLSTVESKMSTEYYEDSSSLAYRKVGMETIVPTLYRYYKENLTVVFMEGTLRGDTISDVNPLEIYKSMTPSTDWNISYTGKTTVTPAIYPSYGYNLNEKTSGKICVFDVDEENARNEPFISDRKTNIDRILNGNDTDTYYYRGNKTYNYAGNPLTNKNAKYLELISREDKSALGGNKTTRKTIITYIRYET